MHVTLCLLKVALGIRLVRPTLTAVTLYQTVNVWTEPARAMSASIPTNLGPNVSVGNWAIALVWQISIAVRPCLVANVGIIRVYAWKATTGLITKVNAHWDESTTKLARKTPIVAQPLITAIVRTVSVYAILASR